MRTSTIAFLDGIASWDFVRIIPCHFSAPIAAGPADLRAAFDAVWARPTRGGSTEGAAAAAAAGGQGKEEGGVVGQIGRALGSLKLPAGAQAGKPLLGVGPATMAADFAALTAVNGFLIKAGIANKADDAEA